MSLTQGIRWDKTKGRRRRRGIGGCLGKKGKGVKIQRRRIRERGEKKERREEVRENRQGRPRDRQKKEGRKRKIE